MFLFFSIIFEYLVSSSSGFSEESYAGCKSPLLNLHSCLPGFATRDSTLPFDDLHFDKVTFISCLDMIEHQEQFWLPT